ncbi:MAG: energy transducer TonB [Candidatus Omnitrophica bacterium]|nr:energy transducer TonB [Candidatus Omnitrophota bacterium]
MKNYWNLAITFSLIFHSALIIRLPQLTFFSKKRNAVKTEIKKEVTMVPENVKEKVKVRTDSIALIEPAPYTENIMDTLIKNGGITTMSKTDVFEKNIKEIVLSEIPPHNKELKKNPAYMNYYRLIREKIRSNTYRYYRSSNTGKVLLSFIVLKDGDLGEFFLDDESVADDGLRQITLESIKDAAPFPPFPDELSNYTQLSFRIPIYFKNN